MRWVPPDQAGRSRHVRIPRRWLGEGLPFDALIKHYLMFSSDTNSTVPKYECKVVPPSVPTKPGGIDYYWTISCLLLNLDYYYYYYFYYYHYYYYYYYYYGRDTSESLADASEHRSHAQ